MLHQLLCSQRAKSAVDLSRREKKRPIKYFSWNKLLIVISRLINKRPQNQKLNFLIQHFQKFFTPLKNVVISYNFKQIYFDFTIFVSFLSFSANFDTTSNFTNFNLLVLSLVTTVFIFLKKYLISDWFLTCPNRENFVISL